MTKLFGLFAVMLMALCLFGLAGFASGAPPGVASLEGTFNVIEENTNEITTDIEGGSACAISGADFLPAIASASNFESNTYVMHAGGGSAIASASTLIDKLSALGGGYMIATLSDLVDHSALTDHVLGGCTCFTFAEPIAV